MASLVIKIIFQVYRLCCQAVFASSLAATAFLIPLNAHSSSYRIRLAVKQGLTSVTVTGENMRVRDMFSYKILLDHINRLTIKRRGRSFVLNGRNTSLSRGIIIQSHGPVKVGKHRYSGRLEVVAEGSGLTVVNDIDLEEYIVGVVSREMSPSWPMEALKAQAVAARTYAVSKMVNSREKLYDLVGTVMDQVYHGVGFDNDRVRKAVYSTRGEILAYRGRIARVFYHSTCGGRTESAADVWGFSEPYLISVPCPYDSESPAYFWKFRINAAELRKGLILSGQDTGRIRKITILSRTKSRRVKRLRITGTKRSVVLSGEDLRRMLGYNRLKSTRFTIEVDGRDLIIRGSGAGHGVGMCQWGARGMAEKGFNYVQILKHYFPGTHITSCSRWLN